MPRKLKARAADVIAEKPKIGVPDRLEAALETARNAQEGNSKLARAVDTLRAGLEAIAAAEWDNIEKRPVTAVDLNKLAARTLDAYSQITGQNWRRNRLIETWASGTGNAPVHERQMSE